MKFRFAFILTLLTFVISVVFSSVKTYADDCTNYCRGCASGPVCDGTWECDDGWINCSGCPDPNTDPGTCCDWGCNDHYSCHCNSGGGGGDGGGDDSCFLPGTKVSTPEGDKKIETLKPGDKVFSFNELTGKRIINTVADSLVRDVPEYYILKTESGKEVRTTAEHPFFTGNKVGSLIYSPKYTKVTDLKVGDRLYIKSYDTLEADKLAGIEVVQKSQQVYNLHVKDAPNNFIADGFAVHNKDQPLNGTVVLNLGAGDKRWLADGVTDCAFNIGGTIGRGGSISVVNQNGPGSLLWPWKLHGTMYLFTVTGAKDKDTITSTLTPPTDCGYTCKDTYVWVDGAAVVDVPGCSVTFTWNKSKGYTIVHVLIKSLPAPAKPTVSVPVCSTDAGYSATISWTGTPHPVDGFTVDISDNSVPFSTFWNKNVGTALSTTAPSGFAVWTGPLPALKLQRGVTYYTRVYNGKESETTSFLVKDPCLIDCGSAPACASGSQLLTNNNFTSNSNGWTAWNGQNTIESWLIKQLGIRSTGFGSGCWYQDLATLRGKKVEFQGSISRGTVMSNNPYFAMNITNDAGVTTNNYGGVIPATGATNTCQTVNKTIQIPANTASTRMSFCLWGAPTSSSYTDWMSVCAIPFTCTGTKPVDPNALLCTGSDTGLVSDTPWIIKTDCLPSVKCAYECKTGFQYDPVSKRCVIASPVSCTVTVNPTSGSLFTVFDYIVFPSGGTGLYDRIEWAVDISKVSDIPNAFEGRTDYSTSYRTVGRKSLAVTVYDSNGVPSIACGADVDVSLLGCLDSPCASNDYCEAGLECNTGVCVNPNMPSSLKWTDLTCIACNQLDSSKCGSDPCIDYSCDVDLANPYNNKCIETPKALINQVCTPNGWGPCSVSACGDSGVRVCVTPACPDTCGCNNNFITPHSCTGDCNITPSTTDCDISIGLSNNNSSQCKTIKVNSQGLVVNGADIACPN